MATALQRAKALRSGRSLSDCDSILLWDGTQFEESHMGYDGHEGHGFYYVRPTWLQILRWIKSGAYH